MYAQYFYAVMSKNQKIILPVRPTSVRALIPFSHPLVLDIRITKFYEFQKWTHNPRILLCCCFMGAAWKFIWTCRLCVCVCLFVISHEIRCLKVFFFRSVATVLSRVDKKNAFNFLWINYFFLFRQERLFQITFSDSEMFLHQKTSDICVLFS